MHVTISSSRSSRPRFSAENNRNEIFRYVGCVLSGPGAPFMPQTEIFLPGSIHLQYSPAAGRSSMKQQQMLFSIRTDAYVQNVHVCDV
jgi:hypothetical protein